MTHAINEYLLQNFNKATLSLLQQSKLKKTHCDDIFVHENHPGEIDLHLNCCTHGNEIIGLSIINTLLNKILENNLPTTLNIGFSLANKEAVKNNTRVVSKDLNRCFSTNSMDQKEDKRARELESVAKKCVAILDIHQTTTETLSPFFVLRDMPYNFSYFDSLNISKWPIILYKDGKFSKDGDAFSSFALQCKIPFITLELGMTGLLPVEESIIVQSLMDIIMKFTPSTWKQMFHTPVVNAPKVDIFQEAQIVAKTHPEDYLAPGFQNLSPISIGSIIAYLQGTPLKASENTYALFPKYGTYRSSSAELIRLLKKRGQ